MEVRPSPPRPQGLSRARTITYLVIIILSVVLLYFLTIRGMRFFLVPSSSMEPTLKPADHILTLKENSYHRGDIIVIAEEGEEAGYLVKRIVGIAGDSIEIRGGAVFVNGQYISEPYLKELIMAGYTLGPVTVPDGHVFLLGDNRNHSEDSASWKRGGRSVPRFYESKRIVGRVCFIYLPPARARRVHGFPIDMYLTH